MDIEVGAGTTPGTAGVNSTLSIENPSNPTPRNPIVVNSVSEVKPKKRTSLKGVGAGMNVSPATKISAPSKPKSLRLPKSAPKAVMGTSNVKNRVSPFSRNAFTTLVPSMSKSVNWTGGRSIKLRAANVFVVEMVKSPTSSGAVRKSTSLVKELKSSSVVGPPLR